MAPIYVHIWGQRWEVLNRLMFHFSLPFSTVKQQSSTSTLLVKLTWTFWFNAAKRCQESGLLMDLQNITALYHKKRSKMKHFYMQILLKVCISIPYIIVFWQKIITLSITLLHLGKNRVIHSVLIVCQNTMFHIIIFIRSTTTQSSKTVTNIFSHPSFHW